MSKRKKTPKAVETDILVKSRRRWCVCFFLKEDDSVKKGQIAHLDGDPSNYAEDNLAFLCFDHHDEYDSQTSQSKGLTEAEIKHYRDQLYDAFKDSGGISTSPNHTELDRKLLLKEIDENRRLLYCAISQNGVDQLKPGSLLGAFGRLSFIYDKHIDRLSELSQREKDSIHKAYSMVRSIVISSEKYESMLLKANTEFTFQKTSRDMLRKSKEVLEALDQSLKLIHKGRRHPETQ